MSLTRVIVWVSSVLVTWINWEGRSRVVDEAFMRRPTEVLRSYLATHKEADERSFELGRVAMALEIVTVMRVLEEYELIAEHERMISILQTLLRDQDLEDYATEWYEMLNEWRRIKLYDAVSDARRTTDASALVGPSDAELPPAPSDAPPSNNRSRDQS
jgi:hypothetical protein